MDNRIFNVNGRSHEALEQTIKLRFDNNGFNFNDNDVVTFEGYIIDPKKGFILMRYVSNHVKDNDAIRFPVAVSLSIACGMVYAWLQGPDALKMSLDAWDRDNDHDGSNELGWRVYCEEWGHINLSTGGYISSDAIAITPAYMWYGK